MDSWAWIPGFGILDLESWTWIPGFGFLNLNENLSKIYDLDTEIANHDVPSRNLAAFTGEVGPETRFFLIALHKLARGLQATLTWRGGSGRLGGESFNIKPTRPKE